MHVDWKSLLKMLAPIIISSAFPAAAPAIPFIVHGIEVAEDMHGSGQEKLAKAIDITNSGINATNQIAGKEVINQAAVNSVISAGVSAVVNATNVIQKGNK